jgi:hypothetical protein
LVGGRILIVECEEKKVLTDFYKQQGFKILQEKPNNSDLLQLIKRDGLF